MSRYRDCEKNGYLRFISEFLRVHDKQWETMNMAFLEAEHRYVENLEMFEYYLDALPVELKRVSANKIQNAWLRYVDSSSESESSESSESDSSESEDSIIMYWKNRPKF